MKIVVQIPSTHVKGRMVVHVCNPRGGRGSRNPGACWPASLAKPMSSKFRDFISKSEVEKLEQRHLTLTSHLYVHRHVCVYICYVHIHGHTLSPDVFTKL